MRRGGVLSIYDFGFCGIYIGDIDFSVGGSILNKGIR